LTVTSPSCRGQVGAQGQPHHRQRRHQRDRDGHAGQRVADVGPDEGDGAHRSGGQRGQQVDQPRADPARHLRVGGGGHGFRDRQADQVAQGDDDARSGDDHRDGPEQVAAVVEHHRQDDAEDRRHQWGDDHRPDDGGRRDDRRQHEQQPEPAQPGPDVGALEEQVLPHPDDVVGSDHGIRTG
jgi:hypothetical protein